MILQEMLQENMKNGPRNLFSKNSLKNKTATPILPNIKSTIFQRITEGTFKTTKYLNATLLDNGVTLLNY